MSEKNDLVEILEKSTDALRAENQILREELNEIVRKTHRVLCPICKTTIRLDICKIAGMDDPDEAGGPLDTGGIWE